MIQLYENILGDNDVFIKSTDSQWALYKTL